MQTGGDVPARRLKAVRARRRRRTEVETRPALQGAQPRAAGDATPKLGLFWRLPVAGFDSRREGEALPVHWRLQLEARWPQAAERVRSIDTPNGLAATRYRDTVHARVFNGRALLLGDAAQAISQQLGQGVNSVLLDARALRNALRRRTHVPDS